MATTLTNELDSILSEAKTPDDFKQWLLKESLREPLDLALLAPAEGDVEDGIIKASGIHFSALAQKVAVRKAWFAARGFANRAEGLSSGRIQQPKEDTPLNSETTKDIQGKWDARHHFTLTGSRMLVPSQVAKIFRDITATTPAWPVIPPETIRTLANAEKRTGTALALKPGAAPVCEEIDMEAVTAHHVLFTRIRALMNTTAYCSVANPAFFSFQDSEDFCDNVFDFMHRRYNQQRPPLAFFTQAYGATMHGFADAIRVQGCTLGQCTRNLSGWQHHWTIWQGAPAKETRTRGDDGGSATISDDVATELKKVQSLARSLQSQHDRNQNYMDRIQREGAAGGKGGGKSLYDNNNHKGGAKGAPKGSGKGFGDRGTKRPFEQQSNNQRDGRPEIRRR